MTETAQPGRPLHQVAACSGARAALYPAASNQEPAGTNLTSYTSPRVTHVADLNDLSNAGWGLIRRQFAASCRRHWPDSFRFSSHENKAASFPIAMVARLWSSSRAFDLQPSCSSLLRINLCPPMRARGTLQSRMFKAVPSSGTKRSRKI